MFPDAIITRPYDVLPLLLFAVGGVTLILPFYRRQPGLFTHALLVSMIPQVAVQLHMAFGSTALFDNHFNIAHFLKIFAYLVPFGGLALDYVRTYAELQSEVGERKRVEEQAAEAAKELDWRNQELAKARDQALEATQAKSAFVADQVGEDLANPCRITDGHCGDIGIDHRHQLQALGVSGLRQEVHDLIHQDTNVEGDGFKLQLAGADLGKVQDVVDKRQQDVG